MSNINIRNYNDFISELLKAGFSGAVGGKDDGVFALFRYGWGAEEETGIQWFTGNPDTDPWEWRVRAYEERDDIAYSKIFFKKAGYITKEWYPYFYAVRRGDRTFEDEYYDGLISNFAKRIYDVVDENGSLSVENIKRIAGIKREDKSKFERALTELQMKMFLTISDITRKMSWDGREYGWIMTSFDIPERFFGSDIIKQADDLDYDEAIDRITEQILILNPNANLTKAHEFITGNKV